MNTENIVGIKKILEISTDEMLKLLESRDKHQYMFMVDNIKNIGAPYLGLQGVDSYVFENSDDFIIVQHMVESGNSYYVELSENAHIAELCELINSHKNSGEIKGYRISSNSDGIFSNDIFIGQFGKLEYKKDEMFGIKNIDNIPKIDLGDIVIRKLTENDEDIAMSFEEIHVDFRLNLQIGFKHYIQEKEETGIIYGAFKSNVLCGYVCVYTFDGKTWDIDYIYVNENHRRKGIGQQLANYYANDITHQGMVASYGGADNEASRHVALASGFDVCSVSYGCDWIHVK